MSRYLKNKIKDKYLKSVKRVRLFESVIEAIKKMIAEDGFKPGDKFYSENILTQKLHVSRSSVREAVRMLEVTGQVNVKHGKGIFITDKMEREFEGFSGWLKHNEQSIQDHFEVRLIIDPKAAGVAALKADEGDIAKMEEVCSDFNTNSGIGNTAGLIKCDEEFHLLLSKSTKNKTLHFLMKTMTKSLPEGWISSLHIPGRAEKTVSEHREILQAIKDRDTVKAEKAMKSHLEKALSDILGSIDKK